MLVSCIVICVSQSTRGVYVVNGYLILLKLNQVKSVKKLLYQMPLLQLCAVYVVFSVAPKLAPGALAGAATGMAAIAR